MKVLMLGVHDLDYPRNSSIRRRLKSAGHEVEVIMFPFAESGYGRKFRKLRRESLGTIASGFQPDVIWLAEFSAQFAPLAWKLARSQRAVFVHDYFVGLYETNVEDWRKIPRYSPRALAHGAMDLFSALSPNILIRDTLPRAEQISAWRRNRPFVFPVEAPDWAAALRSAHGTNRSVLFYGNYIPLHGASVIVEAARFVPTRIQMIGSGPEREVLEKRSPANVVFADSVDVRELAQLIAQSEIVLGVFGTSSKAASVIPNKVLQGLAAGKTVITRESAAYSSLPDQVTAKQLVQVQAGSPQALAEALNDALSVTPDRQGFSNSSALLSGWVDQYWRELLAEIGSRVSLARRKS